MHFHIGIWYIWEISICIIYPCAKKNPINFWSSSCSGVLHKRKKSMEIRCSETICWPNVYRLVKQ